MRTFAVASLGAALLAGLTLTQAKQLPVLPKQFSATIEANIIKGHHDNYTIHMHEHHDVINDRGRTDLYHQPGGWGRVVGEDNSIYDYKNNRYIHVIPAQPAVAARRGRPAQPASAASCKWGDTAHVDGMNAFNRGGGAHITSSEQWFRFGGNITETYMGEVAVRGIICDKWSSVKCSRDGCSKGNYTLDYYFSSPTWSLPEDNGTVVPMRVVLTGWRTITTGRGKLVNGHYVRGGAIAEVNWTNHTYEHYYDYTSFHVGPPAEELFKRPCGMLCHSTNATWNSTMLPARFCPGQCPGSRPTLSFKAPPAITPPADKALPPLPKQFSATIEANIVNKNYTIHMKEWHDVINDRGRTDMYHRAGGWGRTVGMDSSIYDYSNNRYIHIIPAQPAKAARGHAPASPAMGRSCKWGDMQHLDGRNFGMNGGDGAHITSSEQYFRFGGNITEVYQGKKAARGIMCEAWLSTTCSKSGGCAHGKYTLEYYFSDASWSVPEDDAVRVPIRVVLKGWRQTTKSRGKMVEGKYVPGATLPQANWTNHSYEHIYDYTSFHVGAPKAEVFARPCGEKCTSTNTTWNAAELPAIPCPGNCYVAAPTAPSTRAPTVAGDRIKVMVKLTASAGAATLVGSDLSTFEASVKTSLATLCPTLVLADIASVDFYPSSMKAHVNLAPGVSMLKAEEVVSKGKELSITAAGATYTGAQTSCCSISAWSPAPGSPGTTNAGQRASVFATLGGVCLTALLLALN